MLVVLLSVLMGLMDVFLDTSNRYKRHVFKIINKQRLGYKNQAKPSWVIHTIIRFKAFNPNLSSRKLADAFNRQFGDRESVCHSTVCKYLRLHQADVLLKRQLLKRRIPVIGPPNDTWGVDLTGKQIEGKTRWILGVLDHGTRACMDLAVLPDKRSISIVRALIPTMQRFGIPKVIRTDNEAIFTGRLFRTFLSLLGIKHQRIDLACPWQNGRIERFFGTLKEKLDQLEVFTSTGLAQLIGEFRFWYNHLRTHQSLQGYTPAEIWNKRHPKQRAFYYSAWAGLLTGYYHPPDG